MDTESASEPAHVLHRVLAALRHDICRAELLGQCDPVGMVAQNDDLLGTQAPGSDDTAKANGTITDDSDLFAFAHTRRSRCMVTRAHHVRKREQR